jgi:hypothetical protein
MKFQSLFHPCLDPESGWVTGAGALHPGSRTTATNASNHSHFFVAIRDFFILCLVLG